MGPPITNSLNSQAGYETLQHSSFAVENQVRLQQATVVARSLTLRGHKPNAEKRIWRVYVHLKEPSFLSEIWGSISDTQKTKLINKWGSC